MRLPLPVILMSLVCVPLAHAQGTPAPAPASAATAAAAPEQAAAPDKEWRSTAGYPFPAIAQTVADMQRLAFAMQLREYCSDRKVADEFVRERLARFGQLTGRQETCRSLLEY